jgi:hypothetical protein
VAKGPLNSDAPSCSWRVLTRRTDKDEAGVRFGTGNPRSRTGIDAAIAGVATIIHCARSNKWTHKYSPSRAEGGAFVWARVEANSALGIAFVLHQNQSA